MLDWRRLELDENGIKKDYLEREKGSKEKPKRVMTDT